MNEAWLPKSVLLLRNYSREQFVADLLAGLTVGLVALPLAMAFAISSGVPPESGIYCAIVAGFLISALGGSRYQIGGPTGAFVVVVAGIVATYGLDGLFMCTMMAGVMLILLGATGMGTAVNFIPRPVVVGFTNGIGVLIASTQIKDFLGLQRGRAERVLAAHGDARAQRRRLFPGGRRARRGDGRDAARLAPARAARSRLHRRACWAARRRSSLFGLPVETIGTRFGGIPSGWPHLVVPAFRADLMPVLFRPALTVAMLGAIESLMSAVVADRMGGDRHNPNVELIAQGIANIASPLVGGLPATGAIARTATNIRSGARTPVAGMIHALTLLMVLLVAAPRGPFHPAGRARGHPARRRLQHGRLGGNSRAAEADQDGHQRLAADVRADGLRRSHARGRARHDPRDAALHPEGRADDHGVAGDARLRRGGPRPHPAGQAIPPYVSVFRIHGPFLFGTTDKISSIVDHDRRLWSRS